ncbi:PxKF domain-containing protein [Actinomadura sp. ATCC 31491]|uniref:PxKF domain-containing protein n=1 Tax=Actinomadura luzonensis TaxID=2805427 RepID=A0ABT0G0S7_9ACTN|nr:PxKF domain-containing protein [Actinomadura luzonensis]MCK2218214.1 PxKF domain-containing protein [Actinomadura luzonensis]
MSGRASATCPRSSARSGAIIACLVLTLTAGLTAAVLNTAPAHAAYPGVNGKIYFLMDGDIHSVNPDGTGAAPVVQGPENECAVDVSADGRKVVFGRCDTPSELYAANADGTGINRLTTGSGFNGRGLALSPDGTKIAYASADGLKTVNADGTGPATLVAGDAAQPAWSPDGTQIAYVSKMDIYLRDADGTNPRKLTHQAVTGASTRPDWSPDGTKILYIQSQMGPPPAVHVMNADGSGKTTQNVIATSAVWSPDGTKILLDHIGSLLTMDPDGSGQVALNRLANAVGDWAPSRFRFGGFQPPLAGPPAVNRRKAGAAVPVTFSVGAYLGLGILAPGSPSSQPYDVQTGEPTGPPEPAQAAGNSGLSYDPAAGVYTYVWKTDKAWQDTARRLILTFDDGTRHTADILFR